MTGDAPAVNRRPGRLEWSTPDQNVGGPQGRERSNAVNRAPLAEPDCARHDRICTRAPRLRLLRSWQLLRGESLEWPTTTRSKSGWAVPELVSADIDLSAQYALVARPGACESLRARPREGCLIVLAAVRVGRGFSGRCETAKLAKRIATIPFGVQLVRSYRHQCSEAVELVKTYRHHAVLRVELPKSNASDLIFPVQVPGRARKHARMTS